MANGKRGRGRGRGKGKACTISKRCNFESTGRNVSTEEATVKSSSFTSPVKRSLRLRHLTPEHQEQDIKIQVSYTLNN